MARLSERRAASSTQTPTGVVQVHSGDTPPDGWLLCEGGVVSQTTYAALYAIVGSTFNTGGEGVGNFRLPDIRGKFIRGLDGGRGVDSGRSLGNTQSGQRGGHTHAAGTIAITASPTAAPHNHAMTVPSVNMPHTHTRTEVVGVPSNRAPGTPQTRTNIVRTVTWPYTPLSPSVSNAPHTHPFTLAAGAAPHSHTMSGSLASDGAPSDPLAPTHPAPFRGEVRPRNFSLKYIIKV